MTLKDITIDANIDSFDEFISIFGTIYENHAKTLNHLIRGNGYDYISVLDRNLNRDQQHQMYARIMKHFPKEKTLIGSILSRWSFFAFLVFRMLSNLSNNFISILSAVNLHETVFNVKV